MSKNVPSSDIIFLKMKIQSLNVDIATMKKEIDSLKDSQENWLSLRDQMLSFEHYDEAKTYDKLYIYATKKIERFECAMKSLETVRKPMSDACQILRELYSQKARSSYHVGYVTRKLNEIHKKFNLI